MSPVLKIYPPIWFFIFLLCGLFFHFVVPAARIFDISFPWSGAVGAMVSVAGFALSLRASNLFARENTEILPLSPSNRVLVTYGPYRFTRNPMYLGMVLTILGVAIWLGTLPVYISVLADFAVLNFFFIPFEEEKMERQFAEAYRTYKHSVRRWL